MCNVKAVRLRAMAKLAVLLSLVRQRCSLVQRASDGDTFFDDRAGSAVKPTVITVSCLTTELAVPMRFLCRAWRKRVEGRV